MEINELSELLVARLQSKGQKPVEDEEGNVSYAEADVFDSSIINSAIKLGISAVNLSCGTEISHNNSEKDKELYIFYSPMIISYAAYIVLAGAALKERGREFSIDDSGISYYKPNISQLLWEQAMFEEGAFRTFVRELLGRLA